MRVHPTLEHAPSNLRPPKPSKEEFGVRVIGPHEMGRGLREETGLGTTARCARGYYDTEWEDAVTGHQAVAIRPALEHTR